LKIILVNFTDLDRVCRYLYINIYLKYIWSVFEKGAKQLFSMENVHEEGQFLVDEVNTVVKRAIESTLGNHSYHQERTKNRCTHIVDKILKDLRRKQKAYKYVITIFLMQKNGAGLHLSTSCLWNNESDGSVSVRWENRAMYCIVSVFGVAVWYKNLNRDISLI